MDLELVLYISGLTFALVSALKQSRMPNNYAGIASVFIALNLAALMAVREGISLTNGSNIAEVVLLGLVSGLTSSGFYSATKAVAEEQSPKHEVS